MPRILCIDDNRHGCFARQTLLEENGYEVRCATTGKDGLERFGSEKYDLVIVDYFMPGMNGGEVIRKLREISARVPIILLSGYTERLALEERVPEADIALQKGPREVKELLDTVARMLCKRYKRPAARVKVKSKKAAHR